MSAAMVNPDLRRKLKVKIRPDLRFIKQRHGGLVFHVVKDPVTLRYYRFREEELFLLRQFDGLRTFDDIRHEFVSKFRPQRLSVVELEKFVRQLLQAGLASVDTPQLGQRLYERHQERRTQKVKQTLMQFMYLKIPVFDPERLLSALLPWTRFIFTPGFFALFLSAWLFSGAWLLTHWDGLVGKLPQLQELLTWNSITMLWVVVGLVKVMHEFGHGLSCKRFGGEVHEMGFMFMVFSPALYCNVTDSWMLPNKWHRAIIGAAGMYVEAILAIFAIWIWWTTEPGPLHDICMRVVMVCGISTILFNANPLMRFDGYYIMSDLLEVPNLRERSNKYLGNLASRWAFGVEANPDPFEPVRMKWMFATYAVAAYIYKWVVAFGILFFLYTFLKPYKLTIIGHMLAAGSLFTLLVMPCWQGGKTLRNRWRTMKVRNARMAVGLGAFAAVALAALFVPFPMRLDLPMVVQPQDATPIYVQQTGILADVLVKDGAEVGPRSELGRLTNPDVAKERARLQLELTRHRDRERANRNQGNPTGASEAAVSAAAVRKQLDDLDSQAQRLILRTDGASGTVLSPPTELKRGSTFQQGEMFCQIGDPKRLIAFAVVEHGDLSLLKPGQTVWVKLAGHVGAIPTSNVAAIGVREIDELPPALSNKIEGGLVPTQASTPDAKRKNHREKELPATPSFSIRVPLPNPEGMVVGARGLVRVDVGARSLFWRLKRYVQQTFNFKV